MEIVAVRGAISVATDSDERSAMVGAIENLLRSLVKENNISPERIVSIQFTQTSDLIHMNAAAALRIAFPDYSAVPLFCSQEPEIIGMLPRTVRVLITWYGEGPSIPVSWVMRLYCVRIYRIIHESLPDHT